MVIDLEVIPLDTKKIYGGSPMPKSVFITNGKSLLNGQKRAILKINNKEL